MKKIIKLIGYLIVLRFVVSLFNENSSIKEQIDKLKEEITNLEITDLDKKIKAVFFTRSKHHGVQKVR